VNSDKDLKKPQIENREDDHWSGEGLRSKAIKWASSFFTLATPVRLALTFLLSALAGTGALVLAVEYATYHYALRSGFRLPVEGAPYLSLLAELAALGLALSLAVAALLLVVAQSEGSRMERRLLEGRNPERINSGNAGTSGARNTFREVSGCTCLLTVLTVLTVVPLVYLYKISTGQISIGEWILLALLVAWVFAASQKRRPWAVVILFGAVSLLIAWQLFNVTNFESLLRASRLGGGMPVAVNLGRESGERVGLLMLRTESVIVLKRRSVIEEIDLSSVVRLRYLNTTGTLATERAVFQARNLDSALAHEIFALKVDGAESARRKAELVSQWIDELSPERPPGQSGVEWLDSERFVIRSLLVELENSSEALAMLLVMDSDQRRRYLEDPEFLEALEGVGQGMMDESDDDGSTQ
jgi:hypothetical protein